MTIISSTATGPRPLTAAEKVEKAIINSRMNHLEPRCILCSFDFYDKLVAEVLKSTFTQLPSDRTGASQIFGIRLARTPDLYNDNTEGFEVLA